MARAPAGSTLLLTALAMAAFAGNSVLNRMALDTDAIAPAPFAFIRILSGAILLAVLIAWRGGLTSVTREGSWAGAACLYIYAVAFSFAYLSLDAGMGALLLFTSVQFTMIGISVWRGAVMTWLEMLGALTAGAALVYLLSPGIGAPPLAASLLMVAAGVAWGGYSLLGANAQDATAATAGNFLRAVPLALPALFLFPSDVPLRADGVGLAILSGAVTSGLGYAIWYMAVPDLGAIRAAVVQLTVPVLAGLMGAVFLFEMPGARLLIAGAFILGGVGLTLYARKTPSS